MNSTDTVITFSANAGVSIKMGGIVIWVDALHNEGHPSFSSLNDCMIKAIFEDEVLGTPNVIVYTHIHPDHYSEELTAQAMKTWPTAKLILPSDVSDKQEVFIEDVKLRFIKLLHTGKEFKDVEHYGLIVKGGNQTLLISGDCELCDEKLRNEIQSEKIDIAIMNFPWVTLRKGRDVITSFIKPKHLIVVHLPFGEDDICGYLPATEKAIKHFDNASDIIVFRNFVQKKAFLTDLKN